MKQLITCFFMMLISGLALAQEDSGAEKNCGKDHCNLPLTQGKQDPLLEKGIYLVYQLVV
jgi:hypothetical protein